MRLADVIVPALLTFCTTVAAAQTVRIDSFPSQLQVEALSGGLEIAPSNVSPRQLNTQSILLIKDFEHWSPNPYNDSAGYCTIGYGHLVALKSCSAIPLGEFENGISLERGRQLLERDTLMARLAIQKEVSGPISDDQFGALVSFVFNVGERHLKGSQLLQYVDSGNFREANRQFGLWIKAGGEVQNGLIIRRRCEAALFRSELYSKGRILDRSQCAPLELSGPEGEPLEVYNDETF